MFLQESSLIEEHSLTRNDEYSLDNEPPEEMKCSGAVVRVPLNSFGLYLCLVGECVDNGECVNLYT